MHGGITTTVASERIRTGIALLVAGVWAITALSTLVTQNYTALGAVTPVMMVVVGFLYGFRRETEKINHDERRERRRIEDRRRRQSRSDDLSDW